MKSKTLVDVLVTLFGKSAVTLLQFVTTIALAYLLEPTDFGIVAMCTIFLNISTVFVDSGMAGSVIYYNDIKDIDYHTVFWFNLCISFLLYLLLFIFSGDIANFYNAPILESIVKISGLTIVIYSLSLIQIAILTKELLFKIQTQIMIVSSFISSVIAICVALLGWGIWALVLQQLALNVIQAILYIYYGGYYPRFSFSYSCLKKHWRFGSNLLYTSLLKLVYDNMYVQMIGKVVAIKEAGYYNQAKRFNDAPMNILSYPLERVLFPTLAHCHNFDERCSRYLLYISYTIIPLLFLGSILAPDLILLILGNKWENTGWMLSFMLIGTSGAILENMNRNFIKATGKTKMLFRIDLIKRIINIMILVFSLYWGIKGILIAFIINGYLGWFFNNLALKSMHNIKWKSLLKSPMLAIIYSICSIVISFTVINYINIDMAIILRIISCTFIYLSVYMILLFMFQRPFVWGLINYISRKSTK